LGEVRFDFKFYRWQGSIQERRGLITKEPPFGIGEEKGKSLEGINFGFKLTPFLAFDFGGHVNDETLTKNTSTVLVPRHSIVRGYAGFVGAFEWNKLPFPITLTLDESVVYIATPETIGFTTDDGAFLRRIRGFHPHLKTSLDLGFDPSKHYSLSFTYENGRLAPNFEYLNKITAGVKVSY
jgi:hypothetical protein